MLSLAKLGIILETAKENGERQYLEGEQTTETSPAISIGRACFLGGTRYAYFTVMFTFFFLMFLQLVNTASFLA